jgi:hypothetical protein
MQPGVVPAPAASESGAAANDSAGVARGRGWGAPGLDRAEAAAEAGLFAPPFRRRCGVSGAVSAKGLDVVLEPQQDWLVWGSSFIRLLESQGAHEQTDLGDRR